ncbi:putative ribonuclease H-like domain-containing protein [Tanacetum coccineum]
MTKNLSRKPRRQKQQSFIRRKCFRCGDPNHVIGECPKPPRDKNQREFIGGSWSDNGKEFDEKVKDETCLVAHASSEICSESSYFNDENSSIDDIALDNECDKNKPDLNTMSFDDLYNNFKIVEQEVKRAASSSSSSQNMAFVSSPSSTNEVNTAYAVSTANTKVSSASTQVSTASTKVSTANLSDATIYAFLDSQPNRSQLVYEDLGQIHEDYLEEMDLKWQLALLSMRTRRFFKKTGRKITINGSDTDGYDKSKVECFNCHKIGHFAKKCRGPRNQDSRNRNQDNSRRTVNVEETSSKAMVAIDGVGSRITDKSRKGVGFVSYNVVPPPHTGLFSPPNLDLCYSGLEEFQQPKFKVSDDKLEKKTIFPTVAKIEFVRPKQQEKPIRKLVKTKAVNTARPNSAVDNAVRANQVHAVKASACWGYPQKEDQDYVDSGCSRHMTGNMSYLSDFKEFDGGYVTFGGGAKEGKITSKGTFKIVPRKNNMYSVDMKNIVPKKSLTYLVAKAILDESMLWHKRLGHFKNRVMSEFCKKKGIKKKFSIARTPQQNGIAERRNRTLIEAARTMLADSKLPTTFWAEAVNTTCYVQNRVLVVKPHNKTPYELFRGRTPALSFMRPFGCHVTILNTLDYLGKFDGKSDEGFFVRYSMNSDGPKWLFIIDVLTKLMNYVPVVAGTNSNDFVGTEESIVVGHSSKETGSNQDYILMPLWKDGSLFDSSSKNAINDEPQPPSNAGKKDDEVNMSNITTTHLVPSTPNTRIHKDHSLDHVIGDVQSGVQTRILTKTTNEQEFISAVYEGKTHEDLHTCLFACFLSQEEPKKIAKALSDSAWVEAMQEELLQFKLQKVWVLVDLPKEGIDYDEVFAPVARIESIRLFLAYASFMGFMMYQMDVKSDFLYGRIEEEVYVCQPPGFEDPDYPDKVYKVVKALYGLHQAPRAWYETLAKYLLDNGFHRGKIDQTLFIKKQKGDILLVQVYVDDIIFGSTKKELCTEFEKLMHDKFQMSSMGELTFFLGLQVKQKEDGIFISQDKYVANILRKFSFTDVRTASTLMDTENPLLKDSDGDDVNVHLYRSMIRSLMCLTSSRPDIMYLKGQPKLGLWYPRDSSFDLEAYSNSDYTGASLDKKSTTGVCQFLGYSLISWQCKKQTVVASSFTEAKYVAAASCCRQVLWIQNQMLDHGIRKAVWLDLVIPIIEFVRGKSDDS